MQEYIESSLPEAPFSWNIQVINKEGLSEQFTIRSFTLSDLMQNRDAWKELMKLEDFKPEPKTTSKTTQKDYTGDNCPKCDGKLFKLKTAKGIIIKCDNSKWNPVTKKASGCDYIEWPDSPQTEVVTGGASPAQVALIKKLIDEGKLDDDIDWKTLDMPTAKTIIANSIKKV